MSLLDLRPVKDPKTGSCRFENNLTANITIKLPLSLTDTVQLELGML